MLKAMDLGGGVKFSQLNFSLLQHNIMIDKSVQWHRTIKRKNRTNTMAPPMPATLQEGVEKRSNTDPTSWNAADVERWARQVGLSESTVKALSESEIDGPTLATLEKDELRSELGIVSLPARRYLWSLILLLRSYQDCSDRTKAIDVFEEEIDSLPLQGAGVHLGVEVISGTETDNEVVKQLRSDAAQQRQIISDRLMALSLQSNVSQQTYEDAEFAHAEQDRLRQLGIQSEFDQRYARSLDRNGNERPGINNEADKNQIASIFGVSIHPCINSKVNVAGKCPTTYSTKLKLHF
jgi:hypothetical protein